jgi:hypothetical protein
MNTITQLQNIGDGRRLLIIGRGNSVINFRFDLLPDDVDTMAVNEQRFELTKYGADLIPMYIIYMDLCEKEFIEKNELMEGIILISPKSTACARTDFYFDETTVQLDGCTTVYYALQIAQMMGYDETYLIGVDMQAKDGQIRYIGDDKITAVHKREYVEKEFANMIACFDKYKWTMPIYNCNEYSALRKFPYSVPWSKVA